MPPPYDTIVVPGLGGTQLSYKGGQGGKTTAWYDPDILLSRSPLVLALDTDGISPYPILGKLLFPDGPVAMGIYEPLLTFIANHGLSPLFFGYDWRRDLNLSASAFFSFLQSTRLTSVFDVVAHSMGGLVAQLAYPMWLAAGNSPTWRMTVYLDCPHGGSHWANLCLNGLYSEGNWFNLLAPLFKLSVRNTSVLSAAFSAVAKSLAVTTGSWPALYQCLPNPGGQWAGLDPMAGQGLFISNYANGPGGVQSQWLALAQLTQATLNAGFGKPRPIEPCMIGDGRNTPKQFATIPMQAALNDCIFGSDGDGTVTHARGILAGNHVATFSNTGHNQICNTLPPLQLLDTWLAAPPVIDLQEDNTVVPSNAPRIFPTPGAVPQQTWPGDFANKHGDP